MSDDHDESRGLRVEVERASRSGRMVYVRRLGRPSAAILVQRRRVAWPDGPEGLAYFRPSARESGFRGWAS